MTDAELLQQFEARTLPFDQWTHRAHVKVAFTYLCRHPFDEALTKMRDGVQAYNAANNVPDTATSGYNETTTHAFLHLIAATLRAYSETHPTPNADSFCDTHPQLMTRHALRLFYSPPASNAPKSQVHFRRTRSGAAAPNAEPSSSKTNQIVYNEQAPMLDLIEQHRPQIDDLCRRYGVKRLDLFGSGARGDFDPARSDLDFFVEFVSYDDPNIDENWFGLQEDLEKLLGYKVELTSLRTASNPYFLQVANQHKVTLYAA